MDMAFVAPPSGHQQQQQQHRQLHHHHHPAAAFHPYVDGSGQLPQQHHHQYGVNGNPSMPPQMTCDIKPRLTKEQHDILESHFQKQNKPSTNTKKGFAETLNVSLDKVNNWFQNRRAKSKQDAKKQAGAYNLYAQQCQQQQPSDQQSSAFNSDSDTSPAFTSPEYFTMMQQCASDGQIPTTAFHPPPYQEQMPSSNMPNGLPYAGISSPNESFANGLMPPQSMSQDMFDSPQELNRRTLTQEQFDAFTHHGGLMPSAVQYSGLPQTFPGSSDALEAAYTGMDHDDFKDGELVFTDHTGTSLSSNDSSIPSTMSEHSMFPSSLMHDGTALSESSSDWADSRSSSVSLAPHSGSDSPFQPVPTQQSSSSGQWQPGQSIPVDPTELQQQFQEAQRLAQQQQQQQSEQPLAWPSEEVLVRRDSQTGTVLAQQMSSFAIQTPQPQQNATFKSPPPPQGNGGSLAARRQRPRPAALGLASLRSQSYSGAVQPASPSHQSQNLVPAQQLRRIRSSNVINGVAQGRVMKSTPGSAQRSPMSWTFADAMHANQRHAQISMSGNLAPPTPLSPNSRQEQSRPQFPPWQSSGNFSTQTSISESDAEQSNANVDSTAQPQAFTSPPHTPMYHHHHQTGQRIGNTVITENTPPQSAPAVQTSFPATAFMPPPPQPLPSSGQFQQVPQGYSQAHHQQFMNVSMPEQPMHMPASHYAPAQHFMVPASEAPQLPMSFTNGVPIVNPQGQLTMAYPPQMQHMQYVSPSAGQPPQSAQQYSFVANACPPPGMHVTSQLPKQNQPPAEFFVHEYSPPSEVKGAATPRKATIDNGPKNYTFVLVESDKAKKGDGKAGTASSSPASATS
ncbi:hypothetical protein CKM354_000355400 [Cercospora kikuchii]|uniref:Homeobox domain-containing protein n=1 Tax=Cercospora kikuchii TaxID=84275 RepID=A0A9P3FDT5_9PEZI|nr:uncharacterized protein CKM354_000355400 [Cercospora kikuchii]GIZ40202.1 hypothetical protein CKM354_000355400 [Cercospora kikuchii]